MMAEKLGGAFETAQTAKGSDIIVMFAGADRA
jgi:hypothetical protein